MYLVLILTQKTTLNTRLDGLLSVINSLIICFGKSPRHNNTEIPAVVLPISYTHSYCIVNSPTTDEDGGIYQNGACYWDIKNVTLSSFQVDMWADKGAWFCRYVYYITIGY